MRKFYSYLFILIFVICGGIGIWHIVANLPKDEPICRIGIGGGGAFYNPMIDPTNENIFYTTSDMGALYYSHNQGETWDRTEARAVFTQTHIADNGTVFAGGCGVYSSIDKGKTLQLIYPQDVKLSVSRCGWNENLMLAEGYDNGYLKCITSNDDFIFFITVDWEGKLRLLKSTYTGDDLEILYKEQTSVVDPMTGIDVYMVAVNNGLYFSLGEKICFYDFETNFVEIIYTTTGYIKDLCEIEDKIFFIDDLVDKSLILYTTDFVHFNNLLDFNTLTNEFTKYGIDGTFDWHFREISGNNFNNIYLSFSSQAVGYNDIVDGIMKFNGEDFAWVFDSMYESRFVNDINGWSYGCHGPFYGMTSNPHDDNIVLVATIETVYLMEYENEETKKLKTLHCVDYGNNIHSTNGLDVQTTYFVKEDPFDKKHIIICTTDLGIQNSFDNGKTWQRMQITGNDYDIYNTCYDLYFDPYNKDVVYGLWSSRHDAPYNPTIYDRDFTKGALGVSYDGGMTWDFEYSQGMPADSIPVKMSINHSKDSFIIAVATFNRGFYLSTDGGKHFTDINNNIDMVEGLIYGEDVLMVEDSIYCLTAPYLENGDWKPSKFYEYSISSQEITNIDLGNITLARSLTYSEDKGLFINVIPTFKYEWFVEYDGGLWVNEYGGIYKFVDGKFEMYFENADGIFYSAFGKDGKLYATDTYGKVFVIDENGGEILYEGLFNMLKNISFSFDGKIMYVTTFGGGVYRIKL